MAARLPGPTGIAFTPVGPHPAPAVHLGTWQSGNAWSTMKVPLVIAALDRTPTTRTRELARLAITTSDNTAADALWRGLGPPATACAAVQAVLTASGDTTPVQAHAARPPFSAIGQTRWSLTSAATFAATLPCRRDAAHVLQLMGHVQPEHRWGIGHDTATRLKGG